MRCYLFAPILLVVCLDPFLFSGIVAGQQSKTIVNVDVYYESLCGDSLRWIRGQLYLNYLGLKDHLYIQFVPYGKATHARQSETGLWRFTCQHGEPECRGNKAQACGIRAIELFERPENRQRLTVELVVCAMTSDNPPNAVPQCASGLTEQTQNRIRECIAGTEADDLLALHGDKTKALQPTVTFVPTIVINGIYSRENQNAAFNNFPKLICGFLKPEEKPVVCDTLN